MALDSEQDLGTSDEIKEFKHEGEVDTVSDGLAEVKSALGLAADKPPLVAALDYILQIKNSGISPLVVEVANRLKQEQLMKSRGLSSNPLNQTPNFGTVKSTDQFPTICLPAHIPNVNAATLSASYPRATWTTPMLITSSQSTLQHRPYYYNNQTYPTHFTQPSQHVPQQQQQQQQQQQPPAKTKGSKAKKKSTHIKKPLNAFMLYMKEMRAKVVQEYTLKESAAINQILGKRWHALDRSEQARFYEMARRERALHMQMYPNWSARSNYAATGKKKRKRDKAAEQDAGSPKKCRARYGLDKQSSWCKPCRRKKKCVRYLQGDDPDCKDSCDADGENHKPSCPAAHEPGCSVRGADCDCNTHTCGKIQVKKEIDQKDCTCRKDDKSVDKTTPNVVVTSEKELKDNGLHLASVANLSLTREATVSNLARDSRAAQSAPDQRARDNLFAAGQFRGPAFEAAAAAAGNRVAFPTSSMDFTSSQPSSAVSVLSHYPSSL